MATRAGGRNWSWICSFLIWHLPNSILSKTQFHWPAWSHTKAQRAGKNHAYTFEKIESDKNNLRCSAGPHTSLLSSVETHCLTCQTSWHECSLQFICKMNRWQQKNHPAVNPPHRTISDSCCTLDVPPRLMFSTRILNTTCEIINSITVCRGYTVCIILMLQDHC